MRNRLRISIVIENIDWELYIKNVLGYENDKDVKSINAAIEASIEEIEDYWLEQPDLRLTQVLVNLGIIPNKPGFWYYTEEVAWMIEKRLIAPRDIIFWGSIFDKDMNRLPETKWKLVRDLDDDHLLNIIKYFKGKNIPPIIALEIVERRLPIVIEI